MKITKEQKEKIYWIGRMVLYGLVSALIGSMLIELIIYTTAEKLADSYTSGYDQINFK